MRKITEKFFSIILSAFMVVAGTCVPIQAIVEQEQTATKYFSFNSIEDVKDNFESYYVPYDYLPESTDQNGNLYMSSCDPANTWTVVDGVLTRYGEGEYKGGNSRYAEAYLYFKQKLKNFKIEYDYNLSEGSGWKWVSLGFGASAIGGNYTFDGYMAAVETEGTMRLFYENTQAPYISSEKVSSYQEAVKSKWIHISYTVNDSQLKIEVSYLDQNGNEETIVKTKALDGYKGGYVYLRSNTQKMHIKNLTLLDYDDIIDYDPTITTIYDFKGIEDISESFTCYTYKKNIDFGYFRNSDGVLEKTESEKIDPSLAWCIDEEEDGLIRYGEGDYAGGKSGTKGASLLFTNKKYTNFEVSFDYRFATASTCYKWIGVGFGAQNQGDAFPIDSYFAVVEKEGTVRVHSKVDSLDNKRAYINTGANDTYKSEVSEDTDMWHTLTVGVVDGIVYVSYDGSEGYTLQITEIEGYLYLFSNTQDMRIRNLRISVPLASAVYDSNIEIWPEEYNVENYTASTVSNIVKEKSRFSFKSNINGKKYSFDITFPEFGGIRFSGEEKGFFEPNILKNISYSEHEGGVELSAGTEKAFFTYDDSGWQLIAYKNGVELISVDSETLFFGYKSDGTLGRIKYNFPISDGELFYGLGERFNGYIQNGYSVTLWNHDSTYHAEGATGDKTDSYANVPILHSTDGYTLFINSTYNIEADVGCTDSDTLSFDVNGDIFDIYIFTGTPEENVVSYTTLTEKPFIPPEWAFGYWMGSNRTLYDDDSGASLSKQEGSKVIEEVITKYNEIGVELSAYYGEGSFIDNKETYLPLVSSYGIKPLLWTSATANYRNHLLSTFGNAVSLPLIRSTSITTQYYNGRGVHIDYSHPLAKEYFKERWQNDIALGLRGFMVDMGEYISEDTVFYNGMYGDEMHNLYSYYYGKTINEVFNETVADDFVLFQRSGCAGSQGYSVLFGGDQAAKWYGLKQQLNAVLSSASSGFSMYGGDIGGLSGKPTNELYSRWVQFSTFTPIMREHGTTREDMLPWNYDESALANFGKYYQVRKAIQDHIYSSALKSGKSGIPLVKSMAFAYPEQSKMYTLEDQYVFCDSMLVAPIVTEGTISRNVAFPSGSWYDFYSGEKLNGGVTISVDAPQDTIPVYIASGSVIPVSLSENFIITESGDVKTLLVTPPDSDKTVTVAENDNTVFEYSFEKINNNSFVLQKAADERNAVLIYGIAATGVSINGNELVENANYKVVDNNTIIFLSSDESVSIEVYGAGNAIDSAVSEIAPQNTDELNDMICYSVLGDELLGCSGGAGVGDFKKVETSSVWNVPFSGVIQRQSKKEYTSAGGRKGASALYFDDSYTDFELTFSYCYNNSTSWRWISAGFGAQSEGDSYYDSGYLALVEQEGTVKLLGDCNNGNISTYHLYDIKSNDYLKNNKWYTYKLRVVGNNVTVGYDGNEYSYIVNGYSGGRIYLHCFTNGIMFKDIRITDLSADEYSEDDRFEINGASYTGGMVVADRQYALAGQEVLLKSIVNDGYNIGGKLIVSGYNGQEYITNEISLSNDDVYRIIMPNYPIYIDADFYIAGDVNADDVVNIIDLVRLKKHLAQCHIPISLLASNLINDEVLDVYDLKEMRLLLLKR